MIYCADCVHCCLNYVYNLLISRSSFAIILARIIYSIRTNLIKYIIVNLTNATDELYNKFTDHKLFNNLDFVKNGKFQVNSSKHV